MTLPSHRRLSTFVMKMSSAGEEDLRISHELDVLFMAAKNSLDEVTMNRLVLAET